MKRKHFLSTFLFLVLVFTSVAQPVNNQKREIHGSVVDSATHAPLLYTSIYVANHNKGVISNENGLFSLDVSGMSNTDTICFHYIGYKTICFPVGLLDTNAVIYLPEDIYDLNETLVFGNAPDARWIVKKVTENKEMNYQPATRVGQTFIRYRNITDFKTFRLIYKGSTIPDLGEEELKLLEDKIPKYTTSYTDFLGKIYRTKNKEDSVRLKVDPVRTVELKEKEIDELRQFETLFETLVSETGEDEYWKVKTGVLSEKIDKPEPDTVPRKDTLNENKRKLEYFSKGIEGRLSYSGLDDRNRWEFLYQTGRYEYSLLGGTTVNGEDVYIIDFTPKNSGLYLGRLYISVETYALIRADYEYAAGKIGRDIHLLGIGYTENQFDGSISFEKKNGNYVLKYFSTRTGTTGSINRDVEISKKRSRALFDKELMDFDIGLEIVVEMENSAEYLVLDDREISETEYRNFTQPEFMDIIYVDQFDDNLWNGYSIIEPTRRMKEYKKQAVEY